MSPGRLKGHQPFILLALRDGPRTKQELRRKYERLLHYMGLPVSFSGDDEGWRFHVELEANLSALIERGLVIQKEESYSLSPEGFPVAEAASRRARETEDSFIAMAHSPAVAARFSVVANGLLAVLKLATGIAFHSAALVADGFDSLLDVLAALVVLLGVRFGRERIAAALAVEVMLVAGCLIALEGFARLAIPVHVLTPSTVFIVAVVSGAASVALGAYQRAVGRRSGSLSLISQSLESRGHVLQAIGVLAGLVAARHGVFALDAVVAVAIAFMVLKTAVELMLELSRAIRAGEFDAKAQEREYERGFDRHRWNFFKTWTLLTVKELSNRRDIVLRYDQTFTPDDLPFSTQRSPAAGFDYRKSVDAILEELFGQGLIGSTGGELYLTDLGRSQLAASLRRRRFGFFF